MGSNPLKDKNHLFTRKLIPWAIYALLPLALLRLYFYPLSLTQPPNEAAFPTSQAKSKKIEPISCNYTIGRWVRDPTGPIYNGSSCSTIKDGQNCMAHGRPDRGYLYWRWRPAHCNLRPFDPLIFLTLLQHKHLAFVGDSMARNQLESLLCLISSLSPPELIYQKGEDNKFRRWRFPSHNVTISIYWSPFLVKGVEKSASGLDHNELYLEAVDERWASEAGGMDVIVFSVGHWFLHPAVYYEKGLILGCHYCPGHNHTEIGFYDVFRKALRTTLQGVLKRIDDSKGRKLVMVTTFSPSHFEGEWDKFGACPRKKPFKKGEKVIEGMDEEMRKIELEEVEGAKVKSGGLMGIRFEALDVTEMSLLRPDGHPGPYMYPNPFADGIKEKVQNDCVHWCLPGPVDTWNQILVDVMKRWGEETRQV